MTADIVLNGLDRIFRMLIFAKHGLAGGTRLLDAKSTRPVRTGLLDLGGQKLDFLLQQETPCNERLLATRDSLQ